METTGSCQVAGRGTSLLIVLFMTIGLTACLHDNEYQVIGEKDASFPLDQNLTYYEVIYGEEIRSRLSRERFVGLVTSSELDRLEQIEIVPDINNSITLENEGHCYKLLSVDHQAGKAEVEYYAFKDIGDDFYLVSESKVGCFDLDTKAPHRVSLVFVQEDEVFAVGIEDDEDLDVLFERWAHEKNSLLKWWHGISSEAKMGENYKGAPVEKLNVVVRDVSAYEAFIGSVRDKLRVDYVFFTHKNVEQGTWLNELVSRVERIADEREEQNKTLQ